jgi:broad specificity phosphatase PhoE
MKWPSSITFIRHGKSTYNELRDRKDRDPDYQQFKRLYNMDVPPPETLRLAKLMQERYALNVGDYETPLTKEGILQAERTGHALGRKPQHFPTPDVIFHSPYVRTKETLDCMAHEWKSLRNVPKIPDDRIREQEHGLALLYNDWRIFHVNHPEQKALRELVGPYWYQFPQGESVSQVRARARSFTSMLIRECAGMNVLVITHHLTILSFRANYERFTPEAFMRLDEREKPVNCGVTVYRCDPDQGKDGKLILDAYNQKFY